MQFRTFASDRRGNFGLMAALVAVPVISCLGAAVDYSYALAVQRQLQQSADSAAVSALAEQSVGVIAGLQATTDGEVSVGNTDALAFFKANTNAKFATYIKTYTVKVARANNKFTSQVNYSAAVPTSFLGIIGMKSINISGVATGSFVPATYIDFYLMLDNSPSMGLGATDADIAKLESNTSDTCGFACHIDGSTSDYFALAKKLNVTTRIQLVSKAAQAMMTTAKSTRRYSNQYRMAVYSMGAKATNVALTNVASLSSDLDNVSTKTATIDLMSIPKQGYNNDQQTDFELMLGQMKTEIGTGGGGLTAQDPQKVLFFVSDGVNDSYKPSGCLKTTTGGRCQAPLDYGICTKIKNAGVQIAVLYTTYQPINKNSWYNTWIKPWRTDINPQMKACASDGLFFEVSPSQGISDAMNALFLKVVNYPKLTG